MSTKISIADTMEWELFERIQDKDVIRLRAEVRVGNGWGDDAEGSEPRDAEIIFPKKWLREFVAGLEEYEAKELEVDRIVAGLQAGRAAKGDGK